MAGWQEEEIALRPPPRELIAAVESATGNLIEVLERAVALGAERHLEEPGIPGARAAGSALRVLLLEDDPEQGRTWLEALAREGLQVQVVAGEDALRERLALERPDVLLIDYWLDGRTAAEVGLRLGAERSYADIPRVCLTVDSGVQPRQAAMDAGFAAVLRKTIDPSDLAQVLRQVVANARRG